MLRAFGADIREEATEKGRRITVRGEKELKACAITVPGDPSSAAFPLAAAVICPGSVVTVENVLLNPTFFLLIETLHEMGAALRIVEPRNSGGEIIGNVMAAASSLKGVVVPARRAPSMIDEYPVLAAIAAFAEGTTRMEGLAELGLRRDGAGRGRLAGGGWHWRSARPGRRCGQNAHGSPHCHGLPRTGVECGRACKGG